MADLVEANPFPDEPGDRVVVLFLDRSPPPDLEASASGLDDEVMLPAASEVFIHYPQGQGPSKLSFDLGPGDRAQHEYGHQARGHGRRSRLGADPAIR